LCSRLADKRASRGIALAITFRTQRFWTHIFQKCFTGQTPRAIGRSNFSNGRHIDLEGYVRFGRSIEQNFLIAMERNLVDRAMASDEFRFLTLDHHIDESMPALIQSSHFENMDKSLIQSDETIEKKCDPAKPK
jgi:hypothetical protein